MFVTNSKRLTSEMFQEIESGDKTYKKKMQRICAGDPYYQKQWRYENKTRKRKGGILRKHIH